MVLFCLNSFLYSLDFIYENPSYNSFIIKQDDKSLKTIEMIKILKNGDVIFSSVDNNYNVNLHRLSNNFIDCNIIDTDFNLYDFRFATKNNNIVLLDEDTGKLSELDPYSGSFARKAKPKKLFYPFYDDNDKRNEKIIYRLSAKKEVFSHKYKDDMSFQYAQVIIPDFDTSEIIDITSGIKQNEIYVLKKENIDFNIIQCSLKEKGKKKTIVKIPNKIFDTVYEISLSPSKEEILITGEKNSKTIMGLLNLNSEVMRVFKFNFYNEVTIADWGADSSYAVFVTKKKDCIYKISFSHPHI